MHLLICNNVPFYISLSEIFYIFYFTLKAFLVICKRILQIFLFLSFYFSAISIVRYKSISYCSLYILRNN